MPKAEKTHTTHPVAATAAELPAADFLRKVATAAAARAGVTLPSILDLGCHLADMTHAFEPFENLAMLSVRDVADNCYADRAKDLLAQRIDAVQEVIATQPASSLADAAVQVSVFATFAGLMVESCEGANGRRALMMERMALSVLPIIAKAAGLDIDRMAWTYSAGSMRKARFSGVGVQS